MAAGVGAVVTGDIEAVLACGAVAILIEWVAETGDAEMADGLEDAPFATGPSVESSTPAATVTTRPTKKPRRTGTDQRDRLCAEPDDDTCRPSSPLRPDALRCPAPVSTMC